MTKNSNKFLGEFALLFMTLIWGGTFVIVKESLNDVSPSLFIALRFGLATVVLLIYLFVRKIKISKEALLPGMFLGLIVFLGFIFQTNGLRYTSATKSGFITGSLVVMVPLFQTIIEKKIPTRGAQIGTFLVFVGILFLSSGGNSISGFLYELGTNFNLGDWLTLICAVFFALHVVFIDIISPKYKVIDLLLLQLATTAILSLASTMIFHSVGFESLQFSVSFDSLRGIFYTGLLATLMNYGLQTKFQKVVTPTKAGIIYSFEPIFAATFAFFLLSEKISNFGLVGCLLIFAGLIVAESLDTYLERRTNGKS